MTALLSKEEVRTVARRLVSTENHHQLLALLEGMSPEVAVSHISIFDGDRDVAARTLSMPWMGKRRETALIETYLLENAPLALRTLKAWARIARSLGPARERSAMARVASSDA